MLTAIWKALLGDIFTVAAVVEQSVKEEVVHQVKPLMTVLKYFPPNNFRILDSKAEGCREMQQGVFKFFCHALGKAEVGQERKITPLSPVRLLMWVPSGPY